MVKTFQNNVRFIQDQTNIEELGSYIAKVDSRIVELLKNDANSQLVNYVTQSLKAIYARNLELKFPSMVNTMVELISSIERYKEKQNSLTYIKNNAPEKVN